MSKEVDTDDVRFFYTLLEYYLPRLDISSLSDAAFSLKVAQLLKIRELEAEGQVNQTLSKFLSTKK